MPPIDYSVLRACFKNFLGEEQYRKFLAAGVGFELLFWQERAWERFADAYPQFRMTDSERLEALGVCPAHERPLQLGYTASTEGINFRPRSPEEVRLFPRASACFRRLGRLLTTLERRRVDSLSGWTAWSPAPRLRL